MNKCELCKDALGSMIKNGNFKINMMIHSEFVDTSLLIHTEFIDNSLLFLTFAKSV